VQKFCQTPLWQAAAHFSMYFCRNIWDRLGPIAGQLGLLSVLQAKAELPYALHSRAYGTIPAPGY
jgi:hypothetical protein